MQTSRPAVPVLRPGATNPGLSRRLALAGSGRRPVFPVCLAPRRVFRAPGLAARGGGLLPRLFTLAHPSLRIGGGLFSVTLSVSGSFHRPLPAFITRRAALWCPDFPPGTVLSAPLPATVSGAAYGYCTEIQVRGGVRATKHHPEEAMQCLGGLWCGLVWPPTGTARPHGCGRAVNLATTYSRGTCRPTTIGAAAFHFRVRDGNGWFHRAMVTRDRPGGKLLGL